MKLLSRPPSGKRSTKAQPIPFAQKPPWYRENCDRRGQPLPAVFTISSA